MAFLVSAQELLILFLSIACHLSLNITKFNCIINFKINVNQKNLHHINFIYVFVVFIYMYVFKLKY